MDARISLSKGVLTVQELSRHLRISPDSLYRLLKTGQVPAFRVGSEWRFRADAIDQWLRNQPPGEISAPEEPGVDERALTPRPISKGTGQ